jgi:hypothetical protein
LCFIQNKFSKVNKMDLTTTLVEFYNIDELVNAKKMLYEFAETLDMENLPTFTERKGNNKLRTNVDDILTLYTLLDVNKVKLPQYAALNLQRLPSTGVPSADFAALATVVSELRDQVVTLTKRMDDDRNDKDRTAINSSPVKPRTNFVPLSSLVDDDDPQPSTILRPVSVSSSNGPRAAVEQHPVNQGSWAARAASLVSAPGSLGAPQHVSPPRPVARRGKRQSDGAVKAVPRTLTCFVGRLDPVTTESDLKNYLLDVGIKDAICKKMESKDGRVFKTAAFRVSCKEQFRDLFYDESSWPDGALLRDWVFYTNVKNGAI